MPADLQTVLGRLAQVEKRQSIPIPKDGRDGLRGPPGPKGDPGEDGEDGKQGPPGKDGRDGIDGKDGRDGKDGEPGPRGLPGRDGTNGTDGKDGRDGVDGKDAPIRPPQSYRFEIQWSGGVMSQVIAQGSDGRDYLLDIHRDADQDIREVTATPL